MRIAPTLLLLAACSAPLAGDDLRDRDHRANADVDWRDQVIYQIMVDRFANGDRANDYNVEPNVPGRYHGGDWQGIIDQLDYLEDLGVTALWISPVVRNVEEDSGFASYHGYWMQDPVRPNLHFGDVAKLQELVDAAHERDMLVILDVVINHVGQLFYYDINANGRADEWITGGGNAHTCVQICNDPARADECSPDEHIYCAEGVDYLERISEWDPEYDPRGIQGWSATGFSGPADVRFVYQPEHNRTPPARPPAWFPWPDDAAWFDDPSWYSRRGRVYVWWNEGSYSRAFVREQEENGDFVGGLKDLATGEPIVRDALVEAFAYWIEVADFDGFRIDTLKHMPAADVGAFTSRIRARAAALGKHNFFLFGEAFDGNDELIASYTFPEAGVDSVFYFSQKFRVFDEVFKRGGPTRNIECLYNQRAGIANGDTFCADHGFTDTDAESALWYGEPHDGGIGLAPRQVPVSFLDNHDLDRFLWQDADPTVLRNALFFLLTWDGVPCIYYGTEQDFDGGNDPKNREDMVFATGGVTHTWIKDLIALRRDHIALRRGAVQIRWSSDRDRGEADSGIFAFERVHDDETLIVVVNTADDQDSVTCYDGGCMTVSLPPGTELHDITPGASADVFVVADDGTVNISVPPRGGRVLQPR